MFSRAAKAAVAVGKKTMISLVRRLEARCLGSWTIHLNHFSGYSVISTQVLRFQRKRAGDRSASHYVFPHMRSLGLHSDIIY
ncbi:unnamed protein product [Lactuca virosa]|uniref:Uncharacterized protein n=1 Tax=Lactuca virosa TaxID=75947 RepID=A0AAU9PL37_9ASTR|nr:unnamed protein product [Lactuca virosa]